MAKILVIDDEPAICGMLCDVLEAGGHEAVGFENGRTAVEYLKDEPADTVITDIFMPEMEGLETISRVRRLRPEIPIIAISGVDFDGRDYLGIAKKFGAAAALKKPFRPDALFTLLARVLAPA